MLSLGLRSPISISTIRSCRTVSPAAVRAFASSSVSGDRSRGGLPRFYSQILPSSKGETVRVQGDEFWHMAKVLRLRVNDRYGIDRTGIDFLASDEPKVVTPKSSVGCFCSFRLKGGRGDWLVEKCTELGARSITPLLAERSSSITENRVDRLQRVVLAAIKQCQRLDEMKLNPPLKFQDFLPVIAETKLAFLAAAGASPLCKTLNLSRLEASGLIIVGPEGDFTEKEVELMTERGATPVGLGPCRLRVETAAVALLSALMLWSDAQGSISPSEQNGSEA
ncbi:unnamed protein product [Spirodela intermedia]|uniref:16S rRNA (uracil(1498)-N(3))-methyltransferase n=1 Tax=Spirodela intermedia TaxID=51605 RepID=A0A7I8I7P5_SPIIN|nr:unnamed protein product [Spirodela intermedia]CAA6653474.1 unnamed protein product [Spirodela intermedia]